MVDGETEGRKHAKGSRNNMFGIIKLDIIELVFFYDYFKMFLIQIMLFVGF